MIFGKEKLWSDTKEHTLVFLVANNLSHRLNNGLDVLRAAINNFHLLPRCRHCDCKSESSKEVS